MGMQCHWSVLFVRSHFPCFAPGRSHRHLCQRLQRASGVFKLRLALLFVFIVWLVRTLALSLSLLTASMMGILVGMVLLEPGQLACMVVQEPAGIPSSQEMNVLKVAGTSTHFASVQLLDAPRGEPQQ